MSSSISASTSDPSKDTPKTCDNQSPVSANMVTHEGISPGTYSRRENSAQKARSSVASSGIPSLATLAATAQDVEDLVWRQRRPAQADTLLELSDTALPDGHDVNAGATEVPAIGPLKPIYLDSNMVSSAEPDCLGHCIQCFGSVELVDGECHFSPRWRFKYWAWRSMPRPRQRWRPRLWRHQHWAAQPRSHGMSWGPRAWPEATKLE
eukprot:CAMPEP_0115348600 /NCGR_PEP_ID=MMETSP0270-20121206/95488_1 /TAXON_ID=71861 /ORGANISM="Scrippsiella trochoidea, Strain CCMP3099" /LENGTH=207 /DNA_ID=CAMNT_0002770575 /DNA_START=469 /DNA_END=1091 /DNA_ORIENTATION=-